MEVVEGDSGEQVEWTVVGEEAGPSGPLLVAMQPGVDVPAVEVVVVTEGNGGQPEVQGGDIQVIDDGTGQYVSVGAVEEVKEEATVEEIVEMVANEAKQAMLMQQTSRTSGTRGRRSAGGRRSQAAQSRQESSSSDSDDDSSSEEERTPHRKKPKKRDFAHRCVVKNVAVKQWHCLHG